MPRLCFPFFPRVLFSLRLPAALLIAGWLAGCAVLRTPSVPMDTRLERSTCSDPVKTLVVMLPGAWSRPGEFVQEGFVRELHDRGIAADAVIVDAHMAYYRSRTVVDRLAADVLAPARAAGYDTIWLVGISVGGFGALLQAQLQPGSADGLVVLAPYLGPRPLTDEILSAGGLRPWRAGEVAPDNAERRLWQWLQASVDPTPARQLPLYLGYGVEDRFVPSLEVLAAALPPGRVMTAPGGHDWPAWRDLWRQALDRLALPTCATQAAISGQRGLTSKE